MTDVVLVHQANGFAGQVHVIAHVAHGFGRHLGQRAVALHFVADVTGQRGQCRDQFRRGLLAAHVIGECRTRIGEGESWRTLDQRLLGHLGHGGELQCLIGGHGAVQCIGHRQGADQNQHDQAHAFLAVVGAVGEGHAGAGQDQHPADPPWRRAVAGRGLVQGAVLDEGAQGQEQ
ncbi:hypothetical protein D3C84_464110 [compost metagenome]